MVCILYFKFRDDHIFFQGRYNLTNLLEAD